MNITAKRKDDTLIEILEGSMGCDKDIESALESDGYISVIRTNMANVCQITTPTGRAFIAQGGYSAIIREKELKEELARRRREEVESRRKEQEEEVKFERKKDRSQQWSIGSINWIVTIAACILSFFLGKCT